MSFVRACLFMLAALAPIAGYAQSVPAGTVTLLNGQAQALSAAGAAHGLAKGDPVYEGDTLQTEASSYLLVRFSDQGSVLLRPNSRFQVERYQYNGAAPAAPAAAPAQVTAPPESAFFRLIKGGLRAVSGLIAHANYSNYRMSTPVATMGIRGTDYELLTCEGPCLTDQTVLQSVPQGADLNGSVVAGVNDGRVVMTSFTGNSLQLGAGQYAITLADGSQYLLSGAPGFLNPQSAAVAVAGGVAAGNSAAASSLASGTVAVTGVAAVGVAAVVGAVVAGSGSNGSSTSTSTSTATSTATAAP